MDEDTERSPRLRVRQGIYNEVRRMAAAEERYPSTMATILLREAIAARRAKQTQKEGK